MLDQASSGQLTAPHHSREAGNPRKPPLCLVSCNVNYAFRKADFPSTPFASVTLAPWLLQPWWGRPCSTGCCVFKLNPAKATETLRCPRDPRVRNKKGKAAGAARLRQGARGISKGAGGSSPAAAGGERAAAGCEGRGRGRPRALERQRCPRNGALPACTPHPTPPSRAEQGRARPRRLLTTQNRLTPLLTAAARRGAEQSAAPTTATHLPRPSQPAAASAPARAAAPLAVPPARQGAPRGRARSPPPPGCARRRSSAGPVSATTGRPTRAGRRRRHHGEEAQEAQVGQAPLRGWVRGQEGRNSGLGLSALAAARPAAARPGPPSGAV